MSAPTFAFVDLAGYTALTDAHGDEAAAWHGERFGDFARAALQPQVDLVKSIGDAVMLAATDPLPCLLTVEALLAACLHESDFAIARAGYIRAAPSFARATGSDLGSTWPPESPRSQRDSNCRDRRGGSSCARGRPDRPRFG